jgi:hypothetical protein
MRSDTEILERARRPFPGEPLGTLDALHLASALVALRSVLGFALLLWTSASDTLDDNSA